MGKWISLLGIKTGEGKLASLSAFYALLIGLSQVWLKTIPVSLFLTNFDATILPYAYIASAIVLVLLGIIYSNLEKRLTPAQLLYIFIILPAVTFFVFWFFLQILPGKWLYLLLFICASASFDIFDLELWGMLNRLFTLDQAKRMFGSIGLCQTFAGIAGNLLIPFLLFLIGATNIILAVSVCITCAALILSLVFRHYGERFSEPTRKEKPEEVKEKGTVKWLKNSYLVNNMLFAICSLFVYTIVDISFYNVNKVVFPTEIELASFLGIFFALSNGFDLVCRGIVGPLVINKLGVKIGLLIRSVAVGTVALVILLLLPFHVNFYSIFILVALMKLFDEGISNSILRQSVLILYQPLLPRLRSWLQSKIELFVIPLSTIAASVIFIFIQYYFSLNLTFITLLILLMIIATLWITFALQKGYVDNLKEAVAKHYIAFKSQILDQNYEKMILEKLSQGKPHEMVYCLDLLDKMDRPYFVEGLKLCLENTNKQIKEAALSRLQNFSALELIVAIKKILKEDSDSSLRAQAFRALCFQKEKDFDLELQGYIDSEDHVLSDEALFASLKYGRGTCVKLDKLIHSTSPNERLRAVQILGRLRPEHVSVPDLLSLLKDQDPSVAIAVIKFIPSFENNNLYQQLAKALNREELYSSAALAFIQAKERGLTALAESLSHALETNDFKRVQSLLSLIGYVQTPSAIQLLLQHLRMTKEPALKWQIVQALDIAGYQASTATEQEELNLLLNEAADYLKRLLKWTQQVNDVLLTTSLKRQIQSREKQIFLFLRLLYPKAAIQDIAFYFKHEDIDKVSYAHELLENLLNKTHKSLLLPLFEQCHSDVLVPKQLPEAESLFNEMLAVPSDDITKTLKSTVLYLIALLKLKQMTPVVQEAVGDREEMISETAKWTLMKLNQGTNL